MKRVLCGDHKVFLKICTKKYRPTKNGPTTHSSYLKLNICSHVLPSLWMIEKMQDSCYKSFIYATQLTIDNVLQDGTQTTPKSNYFWILNC